MELSFLREKGPKPMSEKKSWSSEKTKLLCVAETAEALGVSRQTVNRLIINIGSSVPTSINDVVATIGRSMGKELTPLRVTAESGGVSRLCADLSRARERLGYWPKVSLDEGIRRTLEAAKNG